MVEVEKKYPFCQQSGTVYSSIKMAYEWIKFRKPGEQLLYSTKWLGRCLGPALNQGNAMSKNVLTEAREVFLVQTSEN